MHNRGVRPNQDATQNAEIDALEAMLLQPGILVASRVAEIVLDLEGVVVADAGAGAVSIPYVGNGFSDGDSITIAGDADYNGTYPLLAGSDADNLVITHAYVAKTFSAGVTATGTPTATVALTVADVTNTKINNYGQTGVLTLQLPAAAESMSVSVVASTTGNALHVKAGASDKIYLSGTALDDGDKVSLANPALMNIAKFWTEKTGAATFDWYCQVISGTWTDGGA